MSNFIIMRLFLTLACTLIFLHGLMKHWKNRLLKIISTIRIVHGGNGTAVILHMLLMDMMNFLVK